MAIEYIDGIRLYRSITAGLRRVVSRQEYLNKINVFPVPDGDNNNGKKIIKGGIAVRGGQFGKLDVYALRKDGFDEPIKISLKGLPDNFEVSPVSIDKGKNYCVLNFRHKIFHGNNSSAIFVIYKTYVIPFRDVSTGKFLVRPLRWWAESAPTMAGIGLRYLKI